MKSLLFMVDWEWSHQEPWLYLKHEKKLRKEGADRKYRYEDIRLVFLDTQQCILNKLMGGACCVDGVDSLARMQWLNNVIGTFMDSLLMALEGDFGEFPNDEKDILSGKLARPEWKVLMEDVTTGDSSPRKMEKLADDSISGQAAVNVWYRYKVPMEMANIHINYDLKMALELHGYGTDSDWECIGKVVAECSAEFYNKIEDIGAAAAGSIDPKFDVPKMRDAMRDEVKKSAGQGRAFIGSLER